MKKILLLISVLLSSFLLASCGGGSSSTSSTSTITTLAIPSALTATASSGTVNLSWNSIAGATSYKIHQSVETFGSISRLNYEMLSDYQSTEVNTISSKITGLTNGETYYFVVTALANGKESPVSNEVIGLPEFPQPSTPTNLRATPSSGTVNLSWIGSTGASYKVYQSTATIIANDLSSYTSYNVSESSIEIPGLMNGTTYYFVIRAMIGDKKSGVSGEISGLPKENLIAPPTNLMVIASSGTVTLNWTGREGATYKVHQAASSFGNDVADYETLTGYIPYDVPETSTKITGLTNGESYYFVVTALIDDKESGASNEVIGNPDFPIPSTPTKLSATPSSGTVNLSWTGSAGVHYYKVYQSTGTIIAADLSSYTSYNVTITSKEIRGLANGTTYYFVVTALKNGKESPASNEVSGFPDESLISPVTNLMVSASSGSVNLSWTGREGATYRVHQSTETFSGVADYEILASYSSYNVTATSTEITDLRNGVSYYFVVTALIDDKESGASNEVIGLPDFPIPSSPTNLRATPSSGIVNLSWTGSEGVHYYKVYRSSGSIGDDLSGYTSYNVRESSIEIPGLTNGETYYFVVTALANGKESPVSNEVIGLPDFPIPSTPTSLRATPSSGTVNLSWIGSTGANYKVYQSTATIIANDLSSYTSYNVRESAIEIPGLMNGTTYYFVIRAMIGDKKSEVSGEISGLPEENLIAPPTNLMVTASSGTVTLNWTGREGATYKVHQAASSFGNDVADYENLAVGYSSIHVTAISTKITGLTNGESYYFVVTALIDDKESGASNEVIGYPDFPPPPPTSLTVTSASSGTVSLDWNSVAGASYKVYRSIGVLFNDDLIRYMSHDITETSTKITGLTNGVSYYFVVTALKDGQESSSSNVAVALPDFPLPSTPTNLIATPSNGRVNLSWMGSAGASYQVYQSTVTPFSDDLSSYSSYNVRESTIEIPGLANGTTYYFVVTALKNGKESPASKEVSGLPEESLISPVTNLMVSASSGSVNLSWTGREGATYRVHQSTETFSGIADYEILASYSSYNVTATSTEITDLRNGVSYYFVVTALIDDKESGASNEVIGLPDFPIPSSPTNLRATPSSGIVNLSWTGSEGVHYYKVYRSSGSIGDDLSGYISYDVSETATKITGLTNGETYYFVVTALANGKESPVSNEINGLPEFPPLSTPTNLMASASSGTVNLSWTGSEGATYRVHQSTETFSGVTDYSTLSAYQLIEVTTSSIKITGLTNNTTYYFVVRAVRGDKESGISDEVSGVPEFPLPSTPTNLSATPSNGRVNLSWMGSAGASYQVYQSTVTPFSDDLSSYSSYNVTASAIEIPGLANGTTYYFVVTALKNGKESPASNEVSGLPKESLIAPPTNLMAIPSSGTVTLSWTGEATYIVHQAEETFFSSRLDDYEELLRYKAYYVPGQSLIDITELRNGRRYYFVVTTYSSLFGKESGASNEVIGLPDFPLPSTPTNLRATPSSGTINLYWDSVAGASYQVYQSTVTPFSDDLSSYSSYNVTASTIEILGLANGTTYYFVVTALKNGKESLASNEVSGLLEESLIAPPTNLMAIPSSGTVTLNWNSVAEATYKVHQSTSSFGTDVADYKNLPGYSSIHVTTTSTDIEGLTNGASYYFVVTALVGDKESGASNEVIGSPDLPIPETPTGLVVTSVSSGTVNLSWESVAGATYKVYQAIISISHFDDELSTYPSHDVMESSIEISGLTNYRIYYFVVTALKNGKESPASDEVIGYPK